MKNIIEGSAILGLVCFSFFYTEKVINMVNENNPLMKEIVSVKSSYEVLPVDAIIDDNTMIPGVNGREVNVDESYDNMKLGGIFREDALIFKDLYPSSSIKDNIDRYIIKGSGTKKQVSIIYIFNSGSFDRISELNDLTIFMNHNDLTISNIKLLRDKEIYTYGSNGVYTAETLTSDNVLINRLSSNKSSYCLVREKNEDVLKACSDMGMYTVLPNIIGSYYEVRNNLSNGSVILLNNLDDFDVIVKYIKGKGYDIVSLSELLNE